LAADNISKTRQRCARARARLGVDLNAGVRAASAITITSVFEKLSRLGSIMDANIGWHRASSHALA